MATRGQLLALLGRQDLFDHLLLGLPTGRQACWKILWRVAGLAWAFSNAASQILSILGNCLPAGRQARG